MLQGRKQKADLRQNSGGYYKEPIRKFITGLHSKLLLQEITKSVDVDPFFLFFFFSSFFSFFLFVFSFSLISLIFFFSFPFLSFIHTNRIVRCCFLFYRCFVFVSFS